MPERVRLISSDGVEYQIIQRSRKPQHTKPKRPEDDYRASQSFGSKDGRSTRNRKPSHGDMKELTRVRQEARRGYHLASSVKAWLGVYSELISKHTYGETMGLLSEKYAQEILAGLPYVLEVQSTPRRSHDDTRHFTDLFVKVHYFGWRIRLRVQVKTSLEGVGAFRQKVMSQRGLSEEDFLQWLASKKMIVLSAHHNRPPQAIIDDFEQGLKAIISQLPTYLHGKTTEVSR